MRPPTPVVPVHLSANELAALLDVALWIDPQPDDPVSPMPAAWRDEAIAYQSAKAKLVAACEGA